MILRVMMRRRLLVCGVVSGGAIATLAAHAQVGVWVVTPAEAALPPARSLRNGRCITRAPAIRQISPVHAVAAGQPFRLIIEFAARGDEKINPSSVQVTMLRGNEINLTDRLRPFITAKGIEIANAMVPAGTHVLEIAVGDTSCRQSSANIEIIAR